MNAKAWFYGQSFHANVPVNEPNTITVGEYTNVPAEHHIHFCVRCQKDYPCVSPHYRTDEATGQHVRDTPPRATRFCGECLFMGV